MKYAFIQLHRLVWPISVMCYVLLVSVAGYHEHFVRRSSAAQRRHLSDDALLVHIKAIHAETHGGYGWPRVWKELLARGIRVGKERVQKLMQQHGIRAKGKRRFKVTTDSNHDLPIAPNLLDRKFAVAEPDKVWAGDITLYLADVENSVRHTRRGQHGHYVRHRAWDVDEAPRLTFAPYRDRTVAKASPSAMSLY
jgi:putative transposase